MAKKPDPDDRRITLLLEDLSHFGESLWRNDEIGEKRFNFFLTLVTAVVAGLVTLHTASGVVPRLKEITEAAIGALLLVGVMTYFRMLQRNRVTTEYQDTLRHIRDLLVALGAGPAAYSVPKRKGRGWVFRAGLAESTGLICGMLLGLLLWIAGYTCAAAPAGIVLFLIGLVLAQRP